MIVYLLWSALFHASGSKWPIAFRLYRGSLLIIVFLFLIGVNVYGWRTSGVNHVLIFELDPRDHLSEQHLIEIASVFSVLWSLSVLAYLYSSQINISQNLSPLALIVIMLAFLLNPTPTLRHNARFWLLRVLVRFQYLYIKESLKAKHAVLKKWQYFQGFNCYRNVSKEML